MANFRILILRFVCFVPVVSSFAAWGRHQMMGQCRFGTFPSLSFSRSMERSNLLLGRFPQNWRSSRISTSRNSSCNNESQCESETLELPATPIRKPTALSFLPPATSERAQSKKSNNIEKIKTEKDPTSAFVDVYEYARKIRNGEMTWEDVETADLDTRLKWVGMLHRRKRTPGKFMMRLRVPNGILTSEQLRFYADVVEPYGPATGVVDITTRANIQLRGITLEDAPNIIHQLHTKYNQTSFQSAMDNVRNIVGSPYAGLENADHGELVDTRPFCEALNDLVTLDTETQSRGNPKWANLPRKFNIAVAGSPVGSHFGDPVHTNLNDVGLQPCIHSVTGQVGFNVVLGGYLSATRVASSVATDLWVPGQVPSVVALCQAILRIFRDEGSRQNRQKARLLWLVEELGVPTFRRMIVEEMAVYSKEIADQVDNAQPVVTTEAKLASDKPPAQRTLLGVHPQSKGNGKVRVGILVPVGRLNVQECREIAYLADKYSSGEIRLTVDQNVLLPNVDRDLVPSLLAETGLKTKEIVQESHVSKSSTRQKSNDPRLKIESVGLIEGHVVSCTGAEFCGLALIETKNQAEQLAHKLESRVKLDRPVHIHWTGCPNSCGQVQMADIGLMGAPAKLPLKPSSRKGSEVVEKPGENEGDSSEKTKAVPGCKIYVRNKSRDMKSNDIEGSDSPFPPLSDEPYIPYAVPLDDQYILPVLVDILKCEFGAVDLLDQ